MSRRWTGRWRDPRTGVVHLVRAMEMVDKAYLTRMKTACYRASAIKSAWTTTKPATCLFCLTAPNGVRDAVPDATGLDGALR